MILKTLHESMLNPPLPRRSARRPSKWVVTLVCNSKAQAMRVEAFLQADKLAKAGR